jgi:hypothetical protein
MKILQHLYLALLLSVFWLAIADQDGDTDPLKRTNDTLNGLFEYYWQVDPSANQIGFFFSCGQIGGWGQGTGAKWDQCSCENPSACSDCYRWWDAIALESIADYGMTLNTTRNSTISQVFFDHSPYNGNWDACSFVDDFLWFGIAYLKVYEWLNDTIWLNRSLALYDWSWTHGWQSYYGGVWWCDCITQQYKDSITIVELLHFSSKLAYMFPKNTTYLTDAQKVWEWFFSFDDGCGLMTESGLVSTGAIPEQCHGPTASNPLKKCHNSQIPGTSYNQGLLMSSAAYLYRATGNKTYLTTGIKALEAIIANYTTSEGIIIDEPRSYQTYMRGECRGAVSDPGGDWYSFQGIFMLHLSYFIDLLRGDDGALSDDLLERVMTFVSKTSDSAWTRSGVWPPFNDICNTSPKNLNITYPKFHWWWGKPETKQIIPPDPHIFFLKKQLRCMIPNNSQLFVGLLGSQDLCKTKCLNNKKCSKFLYQTDQLTIPGSDCWLLSYDRDSHSCHTSASDFNVGMRRPVGGSCAGKCGSDAPVKTADGGMCRCDTDCVKHLDCCLDYNDQCMGGEVPSCKGFCNGTLARPIKGGGYCWCLEGCNPHYTDNNSDSSCCPDYDQTCNNVTIPECLDARSQGSALNLFLAHYKIFKK